MSGIISVSKDTMLHLFKRNVPVISIHEVFNWGIISIALQLWDNNNNVIIIVPIIMSQRPKYYNTL